ncbi:hypothetical protein TBLA_0C05110 [Henningerozyma blattae CBS 6284]|uniref:Uncharacterized protein n=1 Tax=Henningerozyma blattae (strain ATCC 34711 / CBS 6284 / DSM 70876 / NBRC 10599 / NRRL Y-10934 / UCD 77-7) TaxID=1071380 RepID=I2H1Q5_HENB6|nr:hypothetical protein TBLA_0C05110 [Tetrapisispora blattae CBS 6284]CCH60307.1 hypothetical protein TBLA_0C05110 [Tetrapisispora blattae CBS 6284]
MAVQNLGPPSISEGSFTDSASPILSVSPVDSPHDATPIIPIKHASSVSTTTSKAATTSVSSSSTTSASVKTTLKNSSSWDPKDDLLLRHLKEVKKLGWKEIATYFDNRTSNACQFRWRRLKSGNLKTNKTVSIKDIDKVFSDLNSDMNTSKDRNSSIVSTTSKLKKQDSSLLESSTNNDKKSSILGASNISDSKQLLLSSSNNRESNINTNNDQSSASHIISNSRLTSGFMKPRSASSSHLGPGPYPNKSHISNSNMNMFSANYDINNTITKNSDISNNINNKNNNNNNNNNLTHTTKSLNQSNTATINGKNVFQPHHNNNANNILSNNKPSSSINNNNNNTNNNNNNNTIKSSAIMNSLPPDTENVGLIPKIVIRSRRASSVIPSSTSIASSFSGTKSRKNSFSTRSRRSSFNVSTGNSFANTSSFTSSLTPIATPVANRRRSSLISPGSFPHAHVHSHQYTHSYQHLTPSFSNNPSSNYYSNSNSNSYNTSNYNTNNNNSFDYNALSSADSTRRNSVSNRSASSVSNTPSNFSNMKTSRPPIFVDMNTTPSTTHENLNNRRRNSYYPIESTSHWTNEEVNLITQHKKRGLSITELSILLPTKSENDIKDHLNMHSDSKLSISDEIQVIEEYKQQNSYHSTSAIKDTSIDEDTDLEDEDSHLENHTTSGNVNQPISDKTAKSTNVLNPIYSNSKINLDIHNETMNTNKADETTANDNSIYDFSEDNSTTPNVSRSLTPNTPSNVLSNVSSNSTSTYVSNSNPTTKSNNSQSKIKNINFQNNNQAGSTAESPSKSNNTQLN